MMGRNSTAKLGMNGKAEVDAAKNIAYSAAVMAMIEAFFALLCFCNMRFNP
jgi:hypothetical protein